MIKFYVSLRPIKIGTSLITGNEHIVHSFKGLDISHKVVASDFNLDGRMLYEFNIGSNSDYSPQQCADYKAILLEGLQLFSCHEKTLDSALALAKSITQVDTWEISDDSIVSTRVIGPND